MCCINDCNGYIQPSNLSSALISKLSLSNRAALLFGAYVSAVNPKCIKVQNFINVLVPFITSLNGMLRIEHALYLVVYMSSSFGLRITKLPAKLSKFTN